MRAVLKSSHRQETSTKWQYERCAVTYDINISSGGRGRPVTLTLEIVCYTCNAYADFLYPVFFSCFLINQRAIALKQSARVAHRRDNAVASSRNRIDLQLVAIMGSSTTRGNFFAESQTTRNNFNPRRRLRGVFVIPDKIHPTKVKFARERELDHPRFSRALCLYASSGLVIEFDVRTESALPRDSITGFETFFGTHEHEFRAFARRARPAALGLRNLIRLSHLDTDSSVVFI